MLSCEITNIQWFSESEHLWSHWTATCSKIFLQVFVQKLHNSLVGEPVYVGLKKWRDAENNIIIRDYKLRSLLPPQFKKMSSQGFVWLWILYIFQNYTFLITIMAWPVFLKTMLKTEGLGGKQIAYMKHIKIRSCQMVIIFTPKHMICQRQQCVHIHSHIIHFHTGNISCNVVPNVQALIFLTQK